MDYLALVQDKIRFLGNIHKFCSKCLEGFDKNIKSQEATKCLLSRLYYSCVKKSYVIGVTIP